MNILIFLIILLVLGLVHEFGHFFTAKKFGIRVDEFGFGFPPKLFGIKRGETEYTFNALPIGGFVKIFGENPDDENTNGPDKARSFVHKPKYQQAIVLFAGIFANFLLAWLLFSIGFMTGTMPVADAPNAKLTILDVTKKLPAKQAGILPGAVVLKGEDLGSKIENPTAETFVNFVRSSKEKSILLSYERSGKITSTEVALQRTSEG